MRFAALLLLLCAAAHGQNAAQYPDKPITLLAGYPPGGLVDSETSGVRRPYCTVSVVAEKLTYYHRMPSRPTMI